MYAITYNDNGVERPNFEFNTKKEVSEAWFERHHGNTSSLDLHIIDQDMQEYEAGFDGSFFLNRTG